ncbi:type II restriction endonuclease [Aliarcobacter butzleri]|uniref:type II restriction endonuclease n=1 Tax=Aliarcobacter butzleri TaxID=28197 RepID=UPI0021B4A5FF|nr:type II restriction endonuclease [Aliarcobacter butzleri]MCT7551355.1 type II restriction endonuclease [Aliarcobacter butzleri]
MDFNIKIYHKFIISFSILFIEIFKYSLDKSIPRNFLLYFLAITPVVDTNARKNRTGDLMESFVEKFIKDFCDENSNFKYISQATQKKIKDIFNYDIEIDKNSRRFDFALYDKSKNKIYLIEVNYYGGGGSKLKATAGEYQYLYDFLKAQNIDFIWVTDGKGWLTSLNPLEETFNHNDYVINLDMLKKGILSIIT